MDFAENRLDTVRRAEAFSHTQAYNNLKLFQPGSWLAKPVKTVMDLMPCFQSCESFCGLDLGCGVGRNCIPVLQAIPHIPRYMDCVDILPLAIGKLRENAAAYGLSCQIHGIVCPVDQYPIQQNRYDLILAVSVLEHLDSPDTLKTKLLEIRNGLRPGGIACLIVNTSVKETDLTTGTPLRPQFEINLPAADMTSLLEDTFAGMQLLKHSCIHYQYDTDRESGNVRLDTDVVTYVVRKRNK